MHYNIQVYSSGMGGPNSRLILNLETPVTMKKTELTTGECFARRKRHDLSVVERVIVCECSWKCDRDVNAALLVLRKGLGLSSDQAVGLDRPEPKPPSVEEEATPKGVGGGYLEISSFSHEGFASFLWDGLWNMGLCHARRHRGVCYKNHKLARDEFEIYFCGS